MDIKVRFRTGDSAWIVNRRSRPDCKCGWCKQGLMTVSYCGNKEQILCPNRPYKHGLNRLDIRSAQVIEHIITGVRVRVNLKGKVKSIDYSSNRKNWWSKFIEFHSNERHAILSAQEWEERGKICTQPVRVRNRIISVPDIDFERVGFVRQKFINKPVLVAIELPDLTHRLANVTGRFSHKQIVKSGDQLVTFVVEQVPGEEQLKVEVRDRCGSLMIDMDDFEDTLSLTADFKGKMCEEIRRMFNNNKET